MKTIVKAIAGSHLFGLNTEASDHDFKGIYIPDGKDILLQKVKPGLSESTKVDIHSKNQSTDVDVEMYALHTFFRHLSEGQTYAVELLFTPDEFIIQNSSFWPTIQANSDLFVHNRTKAFVGYCRTQANKYGVKGSRVEAIQRVIKALTPHAKWSTIEDIRSELNTICDKEMVQFVTLNTTSNKDSNTTEYFDVCSRKFHTTTKVGYLLDVLQKIYDNYGDRAKLAMENKGIDWKALSHALRVCYQCHDLMDYSRLILPFTGKRRERLLQVKQGKADFGDVQCELEFEMKAIADAEITSKLKNDIDWDFANSLIEEEYFRACGRYFESKEIPYSTY